MAEAPRENIAPSPDQSGMTRRQAVSLGLLGLTGAAALGAACYRTACALRAGSTAGGKPPFMPSLPGAENSTGSAANAAPAGPSASIFKGDAPTGELWELWQKRGWVREAKHAFSLGRNVQCKTCPNACILEPGDRSHCRDRINVDGKLYTLTYGNPCAVHVDPIEKKPLFHFLPGCGAFSLATAGCVLRCLNCQNWDISQAKPEETKDPHGPEVRPKPEGLEKLSRADYARLSLFPEDVVAAAQHFKCETIAYTYSEPIAYFEYTYDTAKLARAQKLRNLLVTCGHINEDPLIELCQYIDAANVNLKSYSEEIYSTLNAGGLKTVLDTLKTLKRQGVWFEVTNLVVPTYTDKPEMMKRMCGWLVDNIGVDYPLHFSRFHPMYKLEHLAPTPLGILIEAREIARKAGLRYVYIGNVRGVEGAETTFCPGCRKPVIERDGFAVTAMRMKAGRCGGCGTSIAGVWANG